MNSSLRVLANCIDLINLHLQMTVGAHIVRMLRVPSHSAMRADDEQRPLQIACSACGKQ